jgi:hypothetical protein
LPNLAYHDLIETLEKHVSEVLKSKDSVLISVTGKNGSGKSYFGRYIRKKGLGSYGRRSIAIIDENTLITDFLFLFKRKIKIVTGRVDELMPFFERLPKSKKIIFYINATPEKRITKADILLKISTAEETRRQRLERRYGKDSESFKKYFFRKETGDIGIVYTYLLEAVT